jgi:hypothetical protein
MVTTRFDGVWFAAYPLDHQPRHVHGFYAEVEVLVDLNPDRTVSLADRRDALRPRNGRRSDVKHILAVANKHFEELVTLWEKHHG